VDLELSDEQVWLAESVRTLLGREWPAAENAWQAGDVEREALWAKLVEFGLLAGGEDRLGAVELCLVARAIGEHLGSAPFLGSVAARYALGDDLIDGDARVAIAMLEPGSSWSLDGVNAELDDGRLSTTKAAVEHAHGVDAFVVVARIGGEPGLALVRGDAGGIEFSDQTSLDPSVPLSRVELNDVEADATQSGETIVGRLLAIGGLLASAEAVGASASVFAAARQYAAERRQFGRTIGSNQALRHLMSDLHVRQASAWSTTLYAAAALDDDLRDAGRTASVAKAYVARAAREVAHGSMQVFGGIAFTEEHPAHRFLRRIIVREQQFGDAAHHERELGRALWLQAANRPVAGEVGAA
jgi:alkylation response protein AidB-like acyl-CoA dehydrogenase